MIVRALGPSLTRQNVTGLLEDPTLELYDANGSLIFDNDDWRKDQADQIIASSVAPTNDTEPAIVAATETGKLFGSCARCGELDRRGTAGSVQP